MRKLLLTSLFIFAISFLFAQEKDKLKTEEIVVEKPYTPTITDAFKVNSNPSIDNSKATQKEKVSYSIFSIPVASTFAPDKGKAKNMERGPKESIYQNYVSVGFGMYMSPLIEAFIHTNTDKTNDFGIFVNHYSSNGGLDDVKLDNNFSTTNIDLYYKKIEKYYSWQANAGLKRNQVNYYGLPKNHLFTDAALNTIDEKQAYKNLYVGGKINFDESIFKGAAVKLETFSDEYNSSEFRFVAKPMVEFPIASEKITSEFLLDIVSGKFKNDYYTNSTIKNSFFNLGAFPNFEINRDNLSINLGAKLYYSNDLERKINEFYAYPNVTASVKIIDDVFILVAGLTGDLIQNTYNNFAEENPYVSPTLSILQTDKQYNAFVGAKGKLASNVSYHFTLNQSSEKGKALFKLNEPLTDGTIILEKAYQAGNSFGVVYDDVKTLQFLGGITVNISKELNLSGEVSAANYDTTIEEETWNLPKLTASISGDYQQKKWFAGAQLFLRGETKDLMQSFNDPLSSYFPTAPTIVKNDGYLDLNLKAGYNFSERLTAFAKINNALGSDYDQYTSYKVQPFVALAGITYKFDLK